MPPRRPLSAARRGLIGLAALVALVCSAPGPAANAAEPDPLGAGWTGLDVGVLPVGVYLRPGGDDLAGAAETFARGLAQAERWHAWVAAWLGRRELVAVVQPARAVSTIRRLAAHREGVTVAAERFRMGLQAYQSLDVEQALAHLDRAERLYADAWSDLSHASEMADVALYQGLVAMEQGAANRAHVAFRRMWLLDPGRRFEPGYYPPATERALAAALEDLTAMPDLAVARYPDRRLAGLAQRSGVDAWLVVQVVGAAERPRLRVVLWEQRGATITLDQSIPLGAEDAAQDALDRALSAWHTCAVTAADHGSGLGRAPAPSWYVDVDFTHVLLLQHDPTRRVFPGPGAAVAVTWEATPILQAWLQISQHAMLPDANQDLVDTFVLSRVGVGAGLTGGNRDIRLYLRAGLETALSFADVEMTTDADCKHFGTAHGRCTRLTTIDAPGAWFGFVVGMGLRWVFAGDWHLHLHAELSSYVADPELIKDLNFPLGLSLGLGHRF